MLKKLLKYDLIFMYKGLIIFYILSILSATCTRIFDNIGDEMIWVIITKICSGVTISMLFNIIINNILRIWARFSRNFYGDESYLTHTLPVTKSTHYASKFLTLFITVTSSVVVMILTLLIAYVESAEQLKVFIESFVFENAKVLDVIVLVVILLLELVHIIQLGYTGMIIGNRRKREDGISRIIVTKVLKFVIRICFSVDVKDANTPYRLMKSEVLKKYIGLIPKEYFLTNVLVSVIYAINKRKVLYLPISFSPRQGGVNSINIRRIIKIGRDSVKDFWRLKGELKI